MNKAMQKRVVMTAQSQKIVDDLHGRIAELEAENTRLSDALAEAEKKGAEDWQPIETAPRDGTEFLGGYLERHRDIHIVKCWYQPEFEAFISSTRVMTLAPGYTFENGASNLLHSPEIEPVTHWMPLRELPAPPRDLSQGGQHG